MTAKSVATTNPLLVRHADLVAQYMRAKTGGQKAQPARRIAELEVDIELAGLDYEPFVKPAPVGTGPTNEEIMAEIESLAKLIATTKRDAVRTTAKRRLAARAVTARARGLEVDGGAAALLDATTDAIDAAMAA